MLDMEMKKNTKKLWYSQSLYASPNSQSHSRNKHNSQSDCSFFHLCLSTHPFLVATCMFELPAVRKEGKGLIMVPQ